ncbi:transmembrane protein 272-like [Salminus brasiliensis]|uniref:transmembrane protein 272-like n=1 Tax=Salminus brasiliensis TaxID=930266 RepID=UPI003B8310BF
MDDTDMGEKMTLPFLLLTELLFVPVPIAQIVIGAVYLSECPEQHYIPLYLVVLGVFGLLALFSCLPCSQNILCYVWNGLVFAFIICWFISGSVWIYSIYPPNYNSTVHGELYCNETVYLFAFWTTTVINIMLAGLLVAGFLAPMFLCISAVQMWISRIVKILRGYAARVRIV